MAPIETYTALRIEDPGTLAYARTIYNSEFAFEMELKKGIDEGTYG